MNTTFEVKEGIKYMLDGFRIKPVEPIPFGNYFIEYYYFEYGRFKFKYGSHINVIDLIELIHLRFIYCLADKNLVKWYRPLTIFEENTGYPIEIDTDTWYESKDEYLDGNQNIKVLRWDSDYFPKSFEECE